MAQYRFMKDNNLLSLHIPAGCTDVMQTCDTVANKPFKVGIKAAFREYLYIEHDLWKIKFPDKESWGQWNPKFTMGTLKKKIAGFVSVAMDTLMTPVMKICIADAFARDGRLTIIRIEECQTLAATRGPNIEGLSVIDSIEPEIRGEVIHLIRIELSLFLKIQKTRIQITAMLKRVKILQQFKRNSTIT